MWTVFYFYILFIIGRVKSDVDNQLFGNGEFDEKDLVKLIEIFSEIIWSYDLQQYFTSLFIEKYSWGIM